MRKRYFIVLGLAGAAALFHFQDAWRPYLHHVADTGGTADDAGAAGATGTFASPTDQSIRRYGTIESTAPETGDGVARGGSVGDGSGTLPRRPPRPPSPSGAGPGRSGPVASVAPLPAAPPRPAPAPVDQPEAVVAEAKSFIAQLTRPSTTPIQVTEANHFVAQDQVISLLPNNLIESTTVAAIEVDPALRADTPITLVQRIEQIEPVTAADLISTADGNLDLPVKVFERNEVREVQIRQLLERFSQDPQAQVSVVRTVPYYTVTTPAELAADTTIEAGAPIEVIKTSYALESATVAELIRSRRAVAPDTVFYIRTVRPEDSQGIWGIVQRGLTENFASGVAVTRGERSNVYQVQIPGAADEMLSNKHSSFLGQLIYRKARESHVYSFRENRMGQNPDRIYPGQQIVIIDFQPEELVSIYQHFVEAGG